MSDSANCTLTFHGILPSDKLDALAALLSRADAVEYNEWDYDDPSIDVDPSDGFRGLLEAGYSSIRFDEVNYAKMDKELQDFLKENRISFCWSNEAGQEYGPGEFIYDAIQDVEPEHIGISHGGIILTLEDLDHPERIARYREIEALRRREWVFVAVNSEDDMAAKIKAHPSLADHVEPYRQAQGAGSPGLII